MHILILNDFCHVRGGADQVALAEARGLAEQGHQVTLWSAVGPCSMDLECVPGLTVVCLGHQDILNDPRRLRAAWQGFWNRRAYELLSEWIRECKATPDVAHLHGWTKALTSSVALALARAGIPTVLTLHDFFVACPTGGFHNHRVNAICRLKPMGLDCLKSRCDRRSYSHKLWRVARQWVQMYRGGIPGRINHFINLSAHSAEVIERFLPKGSNLHKLENPVDVRKRPAVKVAANRDIVYVGRLCREKGVLDFAEAAQRLHLEAHSDLSPVFVGDGELREEILRILPSARITGWLNREGVDVALGQARMLVFPSVWHETYGLSVAESRARGVPVVVSDLCAAREQIVSEVDGLWFRGGDSLELATALKRFVDDTVVRRFGEASYRRYWAEPPTLQRHLTGLMAIYQLVMGNRSSAVSVSN